MSSEPRSDARPRGDRSAPAKNLGIDASRPSNAQGILNAFAIGAIESAYIANEVMKRERALGITDGFASILQPDGPPAENTVFTRDHVVDSLLSRGGLGRGQVDLLMERFDKALATALDVSIGKIANIDLS